MRAELRGRPLVCFAAGLIIGAAALYSVWNLSLLMVLYWLVAEDTGAKALLGNNKAQLAALAGCLLAILRPPAMPGPPLLDAEGFSGPVDLLAMPAAGSSRQSALAETSEGRVLLSLSNAVPASLGDRLWVVGQLRPLSEANEDRWRAHGANAELRAFTSTIEHKGGWLFRQGLAVRQSFATFVERLLDPRSAALVQALCFNQDEDLTSEMRDDLRRTGTIHIISTSGLHVVMLAWMVFAVLGKMPIPRWMQVLLLILILFLYSAAAGFRAPTVRASTMATLMSLGYLFWREPDAFSALAGSAVVVLLLAGTEQILDVGFQISFLTVGALVLGLGHWPDPPEAIAPWLAFRAKQAVLASGIAWLSSIPIVAYHFGQVSLIALVANLAIGFVIAPIIGFAIFGWLAAGVNPAVGAGIMVPAEYLGGYVLAAVHTLGSFEYAAVPTPPFSGYWLVGIYGAALCFWRPVARASP